MSEIVASSVVIEDCTFTPTALEGAFKALRYSNELMTALLDRESDPRVRALLMDQMTRNSIALTRGERP